MIWGLETAARQRQSPQSVCLCVCLCVLLRVIEAENNTLGSWRGGLVIPPDQRKGYMQLFSVSHPHTPCAGTHTHTFTSFIDFLGIVTSERGLDIMHTAQSEMLSIQKLYDNLISFFLSCLFFFQKRICMSLRKQ